MAPSTDTGTAALQRRYNKAKKAHTDSQTMKEIADRTFARTLEAAIEAKTLLTEAKKKKGGEEMIEYRDIQNDDFEPVRVKQERSAATDVEVVGHTGVASLVGLGRRRRELADDVDEEDEEEASAHSFDHPNPSPLSRTRRGATRVGRLKEPPPEDSDDDEWSHHCEEPAKKRARTGNAAEPTKQKNDVARYGFDPQSIVALLDLDSSLQGSGFQRLDEIRQLPSKFREVLALMDFLLEGEVNYFQKLYVSAGNVVNGRLVKGGGRTRPKLRVAKKNALPDDPAFAWHKPSCEWAPPSLHDLEAFMKVLMTMI